VREEAIIRVERLDAGYDGVAILRDVNFSIRRGEVFAIMGTSGAGKTTILRHLIGLDAPVGGRIWVDGEDLVAAAGADRIRLLRKIGVTFQENALFGSLTLLENVRFPLEEHTDLPSRAMSRIAKMKLSIVGLTGAEGRLPSEVSGGMKKRAAIARSLALDPPILFLDEPTTGLDPVTADSIDELIERLSKELRVTCVIVSHSVGSVMRVADRAIVLDPQRRAIVAEGHPREIVETTRDPWVRRFFDPKSAAVERSEP
jgi:phospholipid/cholesterol/gamma-HCH transport system ATP-binding protein